MKVLRILAPGVLCCALALPAGAEYYCEARGVYEVCEDMGGWESCSDQVASAVGRGATRREAGVEAVTACSEHMTKMVITYTIAHSAAIKESCEVTGCEEGEGAPDSRTAAPEPGDFEGWLADGDSRFQQGDTDGAARSWSRASEIAPERPEPYLRMDYMRETHGDWEGACRAVYAGLERAGQTEDLLVEQAECAIFQGRYAWSRDHAKRIAETTRDADVRLAALMVGWIASSLAADGLVSCAGLAAALGARDTDPAWDLTPMTDFVGALESEASLDIVLVLTEIALEGTAAAGSLGSYCG